MEALDEILGLFNNNANEELAGPMERYMKDNFKFLGIKSPDRKIILREFNNKYKKLSKEELIKIVKKLWKEDYREFQYIAMDLLIKYKKLLSIEDIELLEDMVVTKSWWDTVDIIAANIIGNILKNDEESLKVYINKWSNSDNIWINRTALLCQLKYKEDTDKDLLYKAIDKHSNSNEFFIQKAIGWSLREYSKTNPESVSCFINSHTLKPLSIREGSKYLKQ